MKVQGVMQFPFLWNDGWNERDNYLGNVYLMTLPVKKRSLFSDGQLLKQRRFFVNIWKIERDAMRVIKFETKWMPFLSDVFAVVIVMTVYAPFQRSLCVCEPWVRKCGFQNLFCRDVDERPRYYISQCGMLHAFSLHVHQNQNQNNGLTFFWSAK